MATTITPVQQEHISSCLLIDLTLDGTTYYLSSAYKPITYNTNTYTELGSFLSVNDFTEDIKTTNGDISLSLSGIPSEQDYLSSILTTKIKGGNVFLRRGFYDVTSHELDTSQVYTRFAGVITNFIIQEDFNTRQSATKYCNNYMRQYCNNSRKQNKRTKNKPRRSQTIVS